MYSINLNPTDKNQTSISDKIISINGTEHPVDIQSLPQGGYSLKVNNNSYHLHIENIDYKNKTVAFNIDNKLIEINVEEPIDILLRKMGINTSNSRKLDSIKAPMPGMILNIMINEGDVITKGQPILVLEAMKMENVFKAPVDATVKSIRVRVGEAVEKGVIMMELM